MVSRCYREFFTKTVQTTEREAARLLGETDAKAVKDTLDVWYRDQISVGNPQGSRHHAHSGL